VRKASFVVTAVVAVAVLVTACTPVQQPSPSPYRDVVLFGDSNGWGIGCVLGDEGDASVYAPGAQADCPAQPDFSARNQSAGACNLSGATILLYNGGAAGNPCQNWPSEWPQILSTHTPRLVVLSTGGWEIVDRWDPFPAGPNCRTGYSGGEAYTCPAPNIRWGTGETTGPPRYADRLTQAINLFRSYGAKVLVVNAPYYAPPEPQVPGILDVWYEAYGPTQPADWQPPNVNVTFRPSKEKIDQLNDTIDTVVAGFNSPDDVQVFDLWSLLSPGGEFNEYVGGIRVRESDLTHITINGFFQVIAPNLLPEVRAMLA